MFKRRTSKLIIGFFVIGSCLLSSIPAYAAKDGIDSVKSEVVESDFSLQSHEYPSLVHNVATDGYYYFEGYQENTDLYTNYLITGKSKYQVVVKNISDTDDLYLKILGKKQRVAAGTTLVFNITTTASKKFPIFFYSPCYFEGHIG
jgi:hypothetical protein